MNISVIPPSHIPLNPSLSAQTKLNGLLSSNHLTLIPIVVNNLAPPRQMTVSPAPIQNILIVPLLTNVSILIWSVTVILSVQAERTRIFRNVTLEK